MEANDKWESMPSKPKLTIVFGLALLLVVSFITYVTVYAADGRGNVGNIAARWEPLDDGDLGDGDDFGLPPWCRRTPEAASELAAQRARSLGTAWTARGLVARDAAAADVDAAGVAELRTVEACRDALANASCIVGMHPDAAAEPIVDFALRRRVPCFVVPCCARRRRPAAGKTSPRPFRRSTRTSSRGGGTCPRTRTSSRTSPRRTRRRGRGRSTASTGRTRSSTGCRHL